ncbi:MAG TPA: DUF1592 domain-containing protein [Polyangiaceae bacterium]|nr:DUF1592 domain-containing protein [Polyangiaceae bacterium]
MRCTIDPPSWPLRELGTHAGQGRARGLAALALAALLSSACKGDVGEPLQNDPEGAGGSSQTGSGAGGSGVGPDGKSTGGVKLRLLTQAEYRSSLQSLFGTLTAKLTLPDDVSVAGYVSVGASQNAVSDPAATAYEAASLAAVGEVFGDTMRWQKLVGCAPKADLSDACVTTYIKSFGRIAFRRDLADVEVTQWLTVAKNGAMLASSAAQGLATATSGFLQSPNFLYRVESNKLDSSNGRLKYDGPSMATRLSYLLSGGPPSAALLDAAAAGKLDTADGVRAAAAPLLADAGIADRMGAFFSEFAQVQQVLVVNKSTTLFPTFTADLQNSMMQATQLFLRNIVLGPTADVRSFFDSNQTFVDAKLAPFYGVQAPASGFAQVQLPPSSGRAGILGQASVIAGHSQADRSSPTRRGLFVLESFLCTTPPPPPAGVNTVLPVNPNTTARDKLKVHRVAASCNGCHGQFDPLGLAMEHFDPIGQYRATENGLAIDATGTLGTVNFDGAAQLGSTLAQNADAMTCMMRNFYRNVNGRVEDDKDPEQVDSLVQSLAARGYVWRNLLADFVASDAFRSAPALPVTTGSP